MMLTNKKTTSKSWLKVAALLPIVGVALALNAETVTNYVYEDTQAQPQKKVVKKGRQNGQIKMGDKTIEVKAEEATVKEEVKATIDTEAPAIIQMLNKSGKDPLVIINGKKATLEQLKALDPKSIDHINVLKDEAAKEVYGKIYEGEAENGVLEISTKDYAAAHKAKQEATAVGSFTPAPSDNDKTFDVVEQMPEFPGGASELFGFLAKTVKYPVAAQKAGQQGRVIATFVVEKDGSIGNVKVVKSVSEELDAEALRVIGAMPKWKPGMQKGQAVRVKYTIPISFRLQGNEKNEGSEKKEANEDKESSPVNVVGYGPQN